MSHHREAFDRVTPFRHISLSYVQRYWRDCVSKFLRMGLSRGLKSRRGILAEGKCKRCGEFESTFHVMFSCLVARKVWELAPACLVPNLSTCTSVSDLLSRGFRMTNLPSMGLVSPPYPWIMWVLWTSPNQFMFEDKSFSEAEMILRSIKLAKEWQAA